MSKPPPEGAIKIKEEPTHSGFFFRILRWVGGKWTEPIMSQQEKTEILSQQKVDTKGRIINEYD